jgi:hypothetical protein
VHGARNPEQWLPVINGHAGMPLHYKTFGPCLAHDALNNFNPSQRPAEARDVLNSPGHAQPAAPCVLFQDHGLKAHVSGLDSRSQTCWTSSDYDQVIRPHPALTPSKPMF